MLKCKRLPKDPDILQLNIWHLKAVVECNWMIWRFETSSRTVDSTTNNKNYIVVITECKNIVWQLPYKKQTMNIITKRVWFIGNPKYYNFNWMQNSYNVM